MISTLICPNCKKSIEITDALQKHLEEEIRVKTADKIRQEFDFKIKNSEAEAKEEKERNNKLSEELLNLTKQMRLLKKESEDQKLQTEKRIAQEEEKIRQETRQKAEEEHRLKDLEKDKKLQDILKINEELRKKVEQGSQQTQGEVMELHLEKILKLEFPIDEINGIGKGTRGADILQVVVDKYGRKCGSILWESKNASWSNSWISKLKADQREIKANTGVLVSSSRPKDIKTFIFRDGIWITNESSVLGLAWALRIHLGQLLNMKVANTGKNEKMEILFNYLTGDEFKHRVEAIVEAFNNLQLDLEKEKRWFQTKWSRQEKELRKIIDNTFRMHGDLQGVTDRSLPEIKIIPLESGEE